MSFSSMQSIFAVSVSRSLLFLFLDFFSVSFVSFSSVSYGIYAVSLSLCLSVSSVQAQHLHDSLHVGADPVKVGADSVKVKADSVKVGADFVNAGPDSVNVGADSGRY